MHEMRRHSLGGSGVDISRIGLGGYELGPEPDEEPDAQRAAGVIGTAIEGGVNWLDTSENYLATHNEEVIGEALELVGGDFLVASKVTPGAAITGGGSGFRREQVLKACHDSLARLRRDHLDVYFLHWPDDTGIPLEETWGAMAELPTLASCARSGSRTTSSKTSSVVTASAASMSFRSASASSTTSRTARTSRAAASSGSR